MEAMRAMRAFLAQLLSFDTTSSRSNLDLLSWVIDVAKPYSPRIRLIHDDSRSKANLLLSFGPPERGGVVLSAHSDTVPVIGQDWTVPPFQATERDGRIYGRGAADMKGFIAACLAALEAWHEGGLRRPIHLALSYDEELGCRGVSSLIEDMAAHVPCPSFVWVGEPTSMRIATAHKGACVFETEFFGRDAHSSVPHVGHSAIADAIRFAAFLLDMGVEAVERTTAVPGLVPPCTTFNIGMFNGGAALNMVARRCKLNWEFRPIPEDDVGELKARIDAFIQGGASAVFERDPCEAAAGAVRHEEQVFVPPLRPHGNAAALAVLRRIVGTEPEIAVPFGTEAGLFQQRGWPAIVCGPGAIEQAHQPDEWVEVAQLAHCLAALQALPRHLEMATVNTE